MSIGSNPPVGPVNPPVTPDYEKDKLDLEREKLAFEKQKFGAEQFKRDREIEKLDVEIKELKKPYFQKATSAQPIATILVATIAGILTFGTNVFKSDIVALRKEKNTLAKSVLLLSAEKKNLNAQELALFSQKELLLKESQDLRRLNETLVKDRDFLSSTANKLRLSNSQLAKEKDLAPIETRIALLSKSGGPFSLDRGTPSDSDIQYLVSYGQEHRGNSDLIALYARSFESTKSEPSRAVLAVALFELTRDVKWKKSAISIALGGTLFLGQQSYTDLPFFLNLFNAYDLLSQSDKVDFLPEVYRKLVGVRPGLNSNKSTGNKELDALEQEVDELTLRSVQSEICTLASWDKEASVAFPLPWIDCKNFLVAKYQSELSGRDRQSSLFNRIAGEDLFRFSQEVFGVIFLNRLNGLGSVLPRVGEPMTPDIYEKNHNQCPAFANSFPLCRDWQSLNSSETIKMQMYFSNSMVDPGKKWLTTHAKLVDVINSTSELSLPQNKSTLDALIRGVWID